MNLPVPGKDELTRWSNDVFTAYLFEIVISDNIIAFLTNVNADDEFLSNLGIVACLDKLR